GVDHLVDVVPVDRPEVPEPELLEQHARRPQVLDALLDVLREVDQARSPDNVRGPLDHGLHQLAHADGDRARDDRAQVLVHRAYVGGDRHAVVVQHHDDVAARVAGVVHGLVRETGGERAVAYDGDHL